MYQEAQTHRDHRVVARRREYQTLLEILPQARTVLLDAPRRKRYNAYCMAVEMDSPRIPYPEFLTGLMRQKEAEDTRSDILTVRDLSRLRLAAPESPSATKNFVAPEDAPEVAASPTPAAIAEEQPLPQTKETAIAPEAPEQRFIAPPWIGAAVVFAGLLAFLPSMAGVSMILSAPLACISAGVTAYVFAIAAGEANDGLNEGVTA